MMRAAERGERWKVEGGNVRPAFLGVLFSLVVELQGDLGVEADAKVVVHHTLLHVALSVGSKERERGGKTQQDVKEIEEKRESFIYSSSVEAYSFNMRL